MSRSSRSRLLILAARDYCPDAWRRQDDVEDLLTQFHDQFLKLEEEHGRWIPYMMTAVDALRDALEDGTILPAVVPQVLRNAYLHAFERKRPHVTRYMMRKAIAAA